MTDEDDAKILTLVNEFVDRTRRGDSLSIEDYCAEHPDYAEELQELLPALDLLEELQPDDQSSAQQADLPDQIGDYRIVGEIGRGGMGVVYEAEQESLGRRVALKDLPNNLPSQTARVRFQREARAAGKLHHSNIVPVFEVGEDGDQLFYAMQLIRGRGLDVIIDELKDVPKTSETAGGQANNDRTPSIPRSSVDTPANDESDTVSEFPDFSTPDLSSSSTRQTFFRSVADLAMQAANALEYAHARNVIHRDIKPSNLLLDPDGVLWVTDFGLAKTDDEDATLTNTGDYLGTLRYMSPERFRGQCDSSADIYAVGLTLYELVVQKPAFEAVDRIRLIYLINNTDPERPRSVDRSIPRDLETIILKTIDKEPSKRYQSAQFLADDLQRFINDEPVHARRISLREQLTRWARRNRSLATAITGIVTLLIALLGLLAVTNFRERALRIEAEDSETRALADRRKAEDAQDTAERALSLADERGKELSRRLYYSDMRSGGDSIGQAGTNTKLPEVLDHWEELSLELGVRGWEWGFLQSVRHEQGQVLFHKGAYGLRWSPDSRWLALPNGTHVDVIDMNSDQEVHEIHFHSNAAAVDWNPAVPMLATGWRDGSVKFYDLEFEEVESTLSPFSKPVRQLKWDRKAEQLAVSTAGDGIYIVRPFEDVAPIHIPDADPEIRYLSWSADGSRLAGGVWFNHSMYIYEVESGELIHEPRATMVVWSPEGAEIDSWLLAEPTGRIKLYDAESEEIIRTYFGHTSWARSLQLISVMEVDEEADDPDTEFTRRYLVSAGLDRRIIVRDFETAEVINTYSGHMAEVTSARLSRAGDHLASAGLDSSRLWLTETPYRTVLHNSGKQEQFTRELNVTGLAWNSKGTQLVSGSYDGYVRIWDVAEKRLLNRITEQVKHVQWHQDDCVTFGWNGVWSVNPAEMPRIGDSDSPVYHGRTDYAVYNADGTMLAVSDESGEEEESLIITYPEQEEIRRFEAFTNCAAWHPTNPDVIALSCPEGVRVARVGSDESKTFPGHDLGILKLAWSPDGKSIAVACEDSTLRIFEPETGDSVTLSGHSNSVVDVHWHPSGTRLASGSIDGTVRIWATDLWTEVLTLHSNGAGITSLAWSPDGEHLAVGDRDGKINIWHGEP